MENEYIIINKTTIKNRIKKLGEFPSTNREQLYELFQILSQSIPLIPEIEKAFDAGYDLNTLEQLEIPNEERDYLNTQNYIDNLKLEI